MTVVSIVAIAVVCGLAVRYAGTMTPGWVDLRLGAVVDGAHHLRANSSKAIVLGDPRTVVAGSILLGAASLLLGRPRLAVVAAAGPGLTGLLATIGQPVVARTLNDGYAYPSGHTAGATSMAMVLALLFASVVGVGARSGIVLVAMCAVPVGVAMGFTLTAEGLHYPTDTIGGFCLALVAVTSVAGLVDGLADRWRSTRTGGGRARSRFRTVIRGSATSVRRRRTIPGSRGRACRRHRRARLC